MSDAKESVFHYGIRILVLAMITDTLTQYPYFLKKDQRKSIPWPEFYYLLYTTRLMIIISLITRTKTSIDTLKREKERERKREIEKQIERENIVEITVFC